MCAEVTFAKVLGGALNYFVAVVLRICDCKKSMSRNYTHPFGFGGIFRCNWKKMETRLRVLNVRNLNRPRKQKTVATELKKCNMVYI